MHFQAVVYTYMVSYHGFEGSSAMSVCVWQQGDHNTVLEVILITT